MAPWPFIIAAYGFTIFGTLTLLAWSFMRMRSAEARLEQLREGSAS